MDRHLEGERKFTWSEVGAKICGSIGLGRFTGVPCTCSITKVDFSRRHLTEQYPQNARRHGWNMHRDHWPTILIQKAIYRLLRWRYVGQCLDEAVHEGAFSNELALVMGAPACLAV